MPTPTPTPTPTRYLVSFPGADADADADDLSWFQIISFPGADADADADADDSSTFQRHLLPFHNAEAEADAEADADADATSSILNTVSIVATVNKLRPVHIKTHTLQPYLSLHDHFVITRTSFKKVLYF